MLERETYIAHILLDLQAVTLSVDKPYTWASGITSPIYCDNRILISHPRERTIIRDAYIQIIQEKHLDYDIIAGVATSGIPHAAFIAEALGKPMIYIRSKQKAHGKTNTIEGHMHPGQRILVIEDLVSTGGSVLTAIEAIRNAGGVVTDCLAIFTYELETAKRAFATAEVQLHTLSSFSPLLEAAITRSYIRETQREHILCWKKNPESWGKNHNTTYTPRHTPASSHTDVALYETRSTLSKNPTAKRLFRVMAEKQTNLSIAADVTTKAELLQIARECGPEICLLKTHIDIVEDFDQDLIQELSRLATEHNFLIFEDRKFADIGNTVKQQYEKGIYHIADWADIINAHAVPGPGIINGLKEAGLQRGRGLLMLAGMSSCGNLATGTYTEETLKMAQEHKDFVIGFITMKKLLDDPGMINMTPGVQLQKGTDTLGQQYNTPEKVIYEQGSDIIIVGRGIYTSKDMKESARAYRDAGWKAYQKRINSK